MTEDMSHDGPSSTPVEVNLVTHTTHLRNVKTVETIVSGRMSGQNNRLRMISRLILLRLNMDQIWFRLAESQRVLKWMLTFASIREPGI